MAKAKVPPNLVILTKLTTGITSVVSIVYMVLSILGLIFYFECSAGNTGIASQYFWDTTYKLYLQNADCKNSTSVSDVTQSHTIFVLIAITLSFSIVNFITSVVLFTKISEEQAQYINVYIYAYVGSWISTLVVDLTLGTHLGIDITHLSNKMDETPHPNPELDMERHGAFYLMAVALKGFAVHIINLVLIVLMIIYFYEYKSMSEKEMHCLHTERPINAFELVNHAYVEDDTRFSNSRGSETFDRSNSWNHQSPPVPAPPVPMTSTHRPFTYMEEIRGAKPQQSAPVVGGRRPLWQVPPVPAPDYSPRGPRRLKSALKHNY